MTLTFWKQDPWYCGSQPKYTYRQPHEWTAANATSRFWFEKGYFDVKCPTLKYIFFGRKFNPPMGTITSDNMVYDKFYGYADWYACDLAYKGGGAANLTTVAEGDFAEVHITPKYMLKDINSISFMYYLTAAPAPGAPGPKLAVAMNFSGVSGPGIIAFSDDPSMYPGYGGFAWLKWDPVTAGSNWWVSTWDGKDWGTIVFWGGPFTWAQMQGFWPTANTTFAAAYMGEVNTVAPPAFPITGPGSALIDYFVFSIDPVVPYLVPYDLEPPFQTSKWYDAGLYAVCNGRISNLFTFQPIPGDLNHDGVVDITDVIIIALQYGKPNPWYDFKVDQIVDIYDIVVVTKNFGRTTP